MVLFSFILYDKHGVSIEAHDIETNASLPLPSFRLLSSCRQWSVPNQKWENVDAPLRSHLGSSKIHEIWILLLFL